MQHVPTPSSDEAAMMPCSDLRTPADIARFAKLLEVEIEVFGNHVTAAVWSQGFRAELGGRMPSKVAQASDEGLAEVLTLLRSIAPGITPEPMPISISNPRRRRRR